MPAVSPPCLAGLAAGAAALALLAGCAGRPAPGTVAWAQLPAALAAQRLLQRQPDAGR